MDIRFQHLRRDALTACALAAVLGAVWTLRDWTALSALRLPDTDDGMRLQQVRDWLGGQAFADLTQYRLGTGLPMHWTRIADLVPAGSIAALTPLIGRHGAELATVIVWPIALFAIALCLVARIARAAGGEAIAATACVVAGLAYPATTIFLPGRIDHHGLQIVLLLAATLATLGPPSLLRGAAIGGLATVTLVVGLETIPLVLVIGALIVGEWIVTGIGTRLIGLGGGAIAGLIVARLIFAPLAFAYPACDGFTMQSWSAAIIASVAPIALVAGSRWMPGIGPRVIAAILACGGLATAALIAAPGCASPYGAVDPMLARAWLSHVGEAQAAASAPLATVIGYAGVIAVGLSATLWRLARDRSRAWLVLAALQTVALAITLVQLRGAYAGALLGAPALAAMIAAARRRGAVPLAAAWLGAAGMLYPIVAQAIVPPRADPDDQGACAAPAVIAALARLPAGTVMAPVDVGGYGIPATAHSFVAAPYHRNAAGNRAMLRFYRASADARRRILTDWRVDYVVACPGMPVPPAPGLFPVARPVPGVTLFETRR